LLELIDESVSKGCRKIKVCEYLKLSIRTVQNWEKNGLIDKRKGALKEVHNKLTPKEKAQIVEKACNFRFKDLTPYEIVPILAEEGIYIASISTFYRVMRKENLIFQKKRKKSLRKKEHIELKATGPNQLWSWDISWLKTTIRGKYFYLYLFMDIWSRCIVGWDIYEEESGDLAKELFEKISIKNEVKGVILHSDNGGPMISATMRATLDRLGVIPSFSRPNVSNDNAFSESLFKTLKYTAGYPKSFATLEAACEWVIKFVNWYNYEHRHSGIGYVTPVQRMKGEDKAIFIKRNKTLGLARMKNPERWTKKQMFWANEQEVFIKKGNYTRKAS
jgi:transposase InsO family protein